MIIHQKNGFQDTYLYYRGREVAPQFIVDTKSGGADRLGVHPGVQSLCAMEDIPHLQGVDPFYDGKFLIRGKTSL